MTFKLRMRKTILRFFAIFLILFFFRLIYGYISYPNNRPPNFGANNQTIGSTSRGFSNIASTKYKIKKGASTSAPAEMISVDQKYEKTANMACTSSTFEEDEKQIRTTIKKENSIIQFQQKSGNVGKRKLYLQIGVQPDRFDSFIEQIKNNQTVVDFNVTKKDKTNEYRELNSKIKTLQTTRTSLIDLKSKGGKIEEYINLENRILEIDEQLQQLGVKMGNFDTENEFCTVNISLREGKSAKISLIHRIKVALEWTIKYYLMLVCVFCFVLASSYLLLLILDRLKIIARLKD